MVAEGALARTSCSDAEDSDCSEDEGCREGALALPPSFGNVSVVNSSDVHFGNRTFYQGPVTIKQILYANGKCDSDSSEVVLDARTLSDGVVNPVFVPDNLQGKEEGAEKPIAEHAAGTVKGFRRLQKFSQNNVMILVSVLALVLISLVILILVLLLRNNIVTTEKGDSNEQDKSTPIDAPLDPTSNLTLPNKLKLVTRLEWLAQPPVEPPAVLPTPVPWVIIHHTATENCSSQAQCRFHVRYIQTFHIESRNWWDIGYNFLVGGDGEAYEGRGWKGEGAHTYGFNSKSIGIGFIGTFNTILPPARQIAACKMLIEKGVSLGYIRKDYKLLAARQLQTTQSPGKRLYEEIKTWPHWVPGL